MKSKILSLLAFSGLMIIAYFKLNPRKKLCCKNTEQSALATLISKERIVESYNTGLSSGLGYVYIAKFKTGDGRELELLARETEFNELKEGIKGKLTFKEGRFVSFKEIAFNQKEVEAPNTEFEFEKETTETKIEAESIEEAMEMAQSAENEDEIEPSTKAELAE